MLDEVGIYSSFERPRVPLPGRLDRGNSHMPNLDQEAAQVLKTLAIERRKVVADWRVLILLRRAAIASTFDRPLPPISLSRALIRRLIDRQDLEPIAGLRGIYLVVSPYSASLALPDEQIIQEANPTCFFSYLTALALHGLTDIVPNRMYASVADAPTARLPIGTTADDWLDLSLPHGQQPPEAHNVAVLWDRQRHDRGVEVASRDGASIYVTNVERTVIDVLRSPRKAHGITAVLKAWRAAADRWDLNRLVAYGALEGPVMRQRIGYLVERLGQAHPDLTLWRAAKQRGSSLRLLASAPYSPEFNPAWNLSLNVPPEVLGVLDE